MRQRSIMRYVGLGLVLVAFCCCTKAFVIGVSAQSQAERNGRIEATIGSLSKGLDDAAHRIGPVENDVAVLKNEMGEVKWISRGAMTGIVGHICLTLFGVPTRRRRDDALEGSLE